MVLKENDPRLYKSLTMVNSMWLWSFRVTIREVFPERRAELDNYLALISDLAMSYGDSLFMNITNNSLQNQPCTFKSSVKDWTGPL